MSREQAQTPLPPLDLIAELHSDPAFEEYVVSRRQRLSVIRWPWKWIAGFDSSGVAYQLQSDPGEETPLRASAGMPAEELEQAATNWLKAVESFDRDRAARGELELDPEERQRLRALGYVE